MDDSKTLQLSPGLAQAAKDLELLAMPGITWSPYGDDKCDCPIQQVYQATNGTTGWTLMVRLCCLCAAFIKEFPQFAQFVAVLPMWFEVNRNRWNQTPLEWDNKEMDMPPSLWYRRLAQETRRPISDIRREYEGRTGERPRRVKPGHRLSYQQPTQKELDESLHQKLVASGWLEPGDPLPNKPAQPKSESRPTRLGSGLNLEYTL